jgi:hypothetical protein
MVKWWALELFKKFTVTNLVSSSHSQTPLLGRIYPFPLIPTSHFLLQSCRQNFVCILFYRLPRTDSVHLTNDDDANNGNNDYEDTDCININNVSNSSTNIRSVARNSVQGLSVFLISNSCHPWSINCMTGGSTGCYAVPTFSVYPVRFFLFINLIT